MTTISETSNLLVYSQPKPFRLIKPESTPPRDIGVLVDPTCWFDALEHALGQPGVLAFDAETRGTDPHLPHNNIVGFGLAGADVLYYFHREDGDSGDFDKLLRRLVTSGKPLIAHNTYFDGQWFWSMFDRHPKWEACTFGLYRQIATEGWLGQKWGLKDAMLDVLQWGSANDDGIKDWLVANDYTKKNGSADKSQMWRCPREVLGHYCLLDVDATYLLYTRHLRPIAERFPALLEFHTGPWMRLVLLLIEQRARGMAVDVKQLSGLIDSLNISRSETEAAIIRHPDASRHITEWEHQQYLALLAKQPDRYLKRKIGKEPKRYKKDGSQSKGWEKWAARRDAPPVQSKNWEKWEQKRKLAESGDDPDYRFNLRSGDQLRWLIFDRLGNEPVEFTDEGLPSIDSKSLRNFGEIGKLLVELSELNKELSYLTDYLERSEETGLLHPSFMAPGTFTGRLSGKQPNIMQMPKTIRTMSCFTARPGFTLVDLDFAALETVVAAELSGDPALQKLYKDPTKPNDIYLFTAAHIEQFSAEVRSTGYDPDNPTPATIAAAKKQCKHIRGLCKTVVLASQYLAGPNKIHQTLINDGVDVPFEQVQEMHSGFWKLYAGLKQHGWNLKDQWKANRGYILNGIGRPIAVDDKRSKDLVNSEVQSTGHDLLVLYISLMADMLDASGIEWYPYIADWHDAMTVEVPEDRASEVCRMMSDGIRVLNTKLRGDLPLSGKPTTGFTLADVKEPEQ